MPKLVTGLIEAKLATSAPRTARAGARPVEVTTLRITPAGRMALQG